MTKGLALSGGGARGSFQVGALECLYTVFGYRPDVIAGTSVGSVNGLMLAQAQTAEQKLVQLQKLLLVWGALVEPVDFYMVHQWVRNVTGSDSLSLGLEGLYIVPWWELVKQFVFQNLEENAKRSTALAVLDPLEQKMRKPEMFDAAKLATGVPLRMVCVSLESGRTRYTTEKGKFIEDDNITPVASALPRDEKIATQHDAFTEAITSVRTLMEAIEAEKDKGPKNTDWSKVAQLNRKLKSALWRAETAYDELAAANAALNPMIEASVDPVIGALASAAMPGIFGPYSIGYEHYVDGGVRETVPVRAAVQMGATEVIAIICSTQNLPTVGYAGTQNWVISLLSSLANITLKEIVEDDIAGRNVASVPVAIIIPSFDVHDTATIDMGLLDISRDYGFMRAADVMSPLNSDARTAAHLLSDAIIRLRTDTHLLSYTWTKPNQAGNHVMLRQLRLRKWLIRKLVESRRASGVAIPQKAMSWFHWWERGVSSIALLPNPWQKFDSFSESTPEITPFSYIPDGWVYEEEGDLNSLYLIRFGAAFRGTTDTIAAATGPGRVASIRVPKGTSSNLPKVPVAGTVLEEKATDDMSVKTEGMWIVDGIRRFKLNAAAVAALGSPVVAFVPIGGLDQIPDGGTPYWVGGLVVTYGASHMIHIWDPTPQHEGSVTSHFLRLWNRSDRIVTATDVRITTPLDTTASQIFTVRTPRPFSVQVGQVFEVDVQFNAVKPGPITGLVEIQCDDPIAPLVRIPLASSVTPLGSHAELEISPSTLDLGNTLVLATVGQEVIIKNTGSRDAHVNAKIIDREPSGQFAVSTFFITDPLSPGQTTRVYVSYTPTISGAALATLAIDLVSDTDIFTVEYRHRYEVPLSGSATMPTIFLSSGPLPLSQPELTTLDFGTATVNTNLNNSFWIRNIGDVPLMIGKIDSFSQQNFGVTNDLTMFPATIQPGSEIEVPCTFYSGSLAGQTFSSEFRVYSNDPLRLMVSLLVLGRAAGRHLQMPSELVDFGQVSVPAFKSLTFTSDGTDPSTVTELKLPADSPFTVSSIPATPVELAAGNSLIVIVALPKGDPGAYQDQLIVNHNGNLRGFDPFLLKAAVI